MVERKPETKNRDHQRPLNGGAKRVSLVLDKQLAAKVEELEVLTGQNLKALLESMVDRELAARRKATPARKRKLRAKGGNNDLDNLEMLCPTHNRLRAVEQFGHHKMKIFVASLG